MADKKFKGIDKKSKQDLEDLQVTLSENPHLEEVHFTKNGTHYFNRHELVEEGKKTGKFYGYQKIVPKLQKVVGERRFFKNKSVHTPATELIQTMTAEEVLDYEFVETTDANKGGESLKEIREQRKLQKAAESKAAASAK